MNHYIFETAHSRAHSTLCRPSTCCLGLRDRRGRHRRQGQGDAQAQGVQAQVQLPALLDERVGQAGAAPALRRLQRGAGERRRRRWRRRAVVVAEAGEGTPLAVLEGPQNVLVAHFDPGSRRVIGALLVLTGSSLLIRIFF